MNIMLSVFFILLSFVCTKLFCGIAQNSKLIDKPNDRTLHLKPTVRGGGIVFIGLSLLILPFIWYFTGTLYKESVFLLLCILLIAGVSFFDDIYDLPIKIRLGVQCIVAFILAVFIRPEKLDFILFSVSHDYIIIPFVFFMVIWAINHFNFMDGLDGFCASQAIYLLASYFILFNVPHALVYQDFCWILICSLIGFLIFNFPPARLFMGDVGSASLGLIIFSMALIAQQKYQIPIVYWFMLNSLFLFDSTVTLLRRIMNKEQWFAPHKKHAYQRLKQFGMDTRFILFAQLLMNGFIGCLVFLSWTQKLTILCALFMLTLILFSYYFIIERIYPMHFQAS
ncbi:TPA: glycosyltransferase family 4 protein [Legionella pneumophila]|uniref:MraY family glycosyltransferase n=1 Tax=Legionella pneumophila TaxID=446 RepID=UPI0009836E8A|nr:glycosyltransferase family 4 protein [Legionella pneumophila]OOK44528.1 alpha-N-acetylglucosaminyltransferase [Legionella pneumophila subsp. pneumophila str. Mississauga]HAT1977324.1 glycosyltransferase family 4 protein [Legionella pneumophila]HAT2038986.1 glycosyltransferase family 4 protein [Legionella pneumophila]HCU6104559.1 glycosyltransferase family 4 protein [Legionella pneumophila]HEE0244197.1 glycosyltransferase family 4 protein [Legionella pneumophila]